MKKGIVLAAVLSLIAVTVSSAQVRDDVYFDPDKDRVQVQRQAPVRGNDTYDDNAYQDDNRSYGGYDDEYDYYNDYDYYYTSRIRRFHRPHYGFGFFDPIYIDAWHYDPFITPGVTVLIYDDFYSYRGWSRFNQWNRWNSWGPGWNSWGPGINIGISFGLNRWNAWDPWGWNSWNRWNSWNSWGWNSWNNVNRFGWNSWGFGGPYWFGGGSFACPPTWGNGFAYNTVVNINNENNNFYGPRGGGGATGPAPGARPGRAPGFIDNSPGTAPRTINTAGDRLPESDRARIPAVSGSGARGEINNPGERATPQPNRDADRFFDRYPDRNTETIRRDVPSTRVPSNDRVPSSTERTAPVKPNSNSSGARTSPYPSYNPNNNSTYERPRSIDSGSRATPNTTRTSPSASERPRVYTPPTRTYDRNSDSSYDRPRSTTPSNSNNSGFSSPRSSGSNSSFSSPRNSDPSGGSINNPSSRSGSSSSGSSGSSSSSGGRTRGN